MNIFERAARARLRFTAPAGTVPAGELTVEHLFDLPLTATGSRLSLDRLGQAVRRDLREFGEESLVDLKTDPRKTELELKFELIKHVIASKQADLVAAATRAANMAERQQLLEIKARKQAGKLEEMSEEAIEKRLAELGG